MTPGFSFKTFVVIAILIGVSVSSITYAFASSNTAYPNPAGNGNGDISGYVISNVHYNPGNDPAKIASVTLTLNAPATRVNIRLSDTQSNWYGCSNVNGNDWLCNTENALLKSANQLQVSASGN